MPHDIADAFCQQERHDGEAYKTEDMRQNISKRICIEYAQLIYYVIMTQREEPRQCLKRWIHGKDRKGTSYH